jgi:hypothetical protein
MRENQQMHQLFIQFINYIRGVSKTFGKWYQKTDITEDTKKK